MRNKFLSLALMFGIALPLLAFAVTEYNDPIAMCKRRVNEKYAVTSVKDLMAKGFTVEFAIAGDKLVVPPNGLPFPDKRAHFTFVKGALKKDTYTKIAARTSLRLKGEKGFSCNKADGTCTFHFESDGLIEALVFDEKLTQAGVANIFYQAAGTLPNFTMTFSGKEKDDKLAKCDEINVEEASANPKVQEAMKPKSVHRKGAVPTGDAKTTVETTL